MKLNKYFILIMALGILACEPDEGQPEPEEFGYLSLNVTLTITSEEATGRLDAVDTDNFRVTIFDAGGTEIMVFDPFSSAPAEVPLPTGEYYAEAHSNNLVDAAFENPYYFGRSANFTIDKEETTTIDIEPELANTKVAILYSENVENTFDSYTGTVEVIATGATLFYSQGETREGYFIVSPLEVAVNLSYTKLDGTTIDRVFTTTIDDPQPKTLYNINVDATLEDGVIIFNIVVDESFDVIDVDLGENVGPGASWILNYGGSLDDAFSDVIELSDGNILFVGSSSSQDGDISQPRGNLDVWVVKADKSGNIIWSKNYGGSDGDLGVAAVENADGTIGILAETTSQDGDVSFSNSGLNYDMWLFELDANGNLLWEKTYGYFQMETSAGLVGMPDGGYVISGTTQVNDLFSADAILYRVGNSGNIIWEQIFSEAGFLQIADLQRHTNGLFYINGTETITGTSGVVNAIIISFNENGNQQNVIKRSIPQGISSIDAMFFNNGSIVIAGATSSYDGYAAQFSTGGTLLWDEIYTEGQVYDIQSTRSALYMVGSDYDGTSVQMVLIETDLSGNLSNSYYVGGSASDVATGLVVNSPDEFLISGRSASTDGGFINLGQDDGVLIQFTTN